MEYETITNENGYIYYRTPYTNTQALWNFALMWEEEQRPYWKRIREESLDILLKVFVDDVKEQK